jgi:putative salt-induced outer membrane protein YdiY
LEEKLMKTLTRLLLPALSLFFATSIFASEITLKNGDRVSGKIVEESDAAVVLETDYAGTIKISRTHIKEIADETAVAVRSSEKEIVTDSASGPSASEAKNESATLEKAKTSLAAAPKNAAPAPAAIAPPKAPKRLFGGKYLGIMEGWEGNANVGFSYNSGNSTNTTMATGLRAVKSGGRDNLTIYARSLWNSNHGTGRMVTTQNAFWGGARYDRDINDRMFSFISYDFERDRPQKLSFRSVAGGGIGRHWIKGEDTQMDVLLGGAWNRTWKTNGENTDTPEMINGVTLKHKFHERMKVQNTFTFYQNITDMSEYRFIFDTTLSTDVTKRVGVFFTVGNRYNNDPFGSSKKNDFLFTTGMKWNFGKKK